MPYTWRSYATEYKVCMQYERLMYTVVKTILLTETAEELLENLGNVEL